MGRQANQARKANQAQRPFRAHRSHRRTRTTGRSGTGRSERPSRSVRAGGVCRVLCSDAARQSSDRRGWHTGRIPPEWPDERSDRPTQCDRIRPTARRHLSRDLLGIHGRARSAGDRSRLRGRNGRIALHRLRAGDRDEPDLRRSACQDHRPRLCDRGSKPRRERARFDSNPKSWGHARGRRFDHRPTTGLISRPGSHPANALFGALLDVHPRDRPGDHQLLDLGGALEDVIDLRVAVPALDGELARVAVAAEDLHRALGHPHGDLAGLQL
jgi:hypothetical protein